MVSSVHQRSSSGLGAGLGAGLVYQGVVQGSARRRWALWFPVVLVLFWSSGGCLVKGGRVRRGVGGVSEVMEGGRGRRGVGGVSEVVEGGRGQRGVGGVSEVMTDVSQLSGGWSWRGSLGCVLKPHPSVSWRRC